MAGCCATSKDKKLTTFFLFKMTYSHHSSIKLEELIHGEKQDEETMNEVKKRIKELRNKCSNREAQVHARLVEYVPSFLIFNRSVLISSLIPFLICQKNQDEALFTLSLELLSNAIMQNEENQNEIWCSQFPSFFTFCFGFIFFFLIVVFFFFFAVLWPK